ncbi:hypothetical protein [Paracoccus rhizosphaerae]|uniref:Uncharacterized protein n=1 Tax=Paracoccus rhizosphaerae TaxID=1133347 RepID=A0ABV6CDY1_9RHOB|nr:hypothetical protein [Paracoccus rhizosphaerae]
MPGKRLLLPVLIVLLPIAVALTWHAPSDTKAFFSEAGPIERLSAGFLLLSFAWLALRRDASRWHQVVLILAAALRELDWDKAFTERGVLSLGLYTGDHPMGQKLAGAAVLVVLVWAVQRLLRRDLRPWLVGLRRGVGTSWAMLAAVLLYVMAKTLDGLGRKLAPLGVETSQQLNEVAGRSEEVLELFGAILILWIVAISRR